MEDVGATVAVQPSERLYCVHMFSCKTRTNAFELNRRTTLCTRTLLSSSSLYQKVFKLAAQWCPFESLPSEDLTCLQP